MLKFNRKTEYALLALQHLNGSDDKSITKVREIAVTFNIPFPVLAKVMQQLARYDFVEPLQGARGGYRLGPRGLDSSILQFLEAMEGPQGLVDCLADGECDQLANCTIRTPLSELDITIRQFFSNIKLQDVLGGTSAHQIFGAPLPSRHMT